MTPSTPNEPTLTDVIARLDNLSGKVQNLSDKVEKLSGKMNRQAVDRDCFSSHQVTQRMVRLDFVLIRFSRLDGHHHGSL